MPPNWTGAKLRRRAAKSTVDYTRADIAFPSKIFWRAAKSLMAGSVSLSDWLGGNTVCSQK